MKRKALMILAWLPLMARAAISVGTTVAPGQWCGDFAAAKSYAEQKGCPLVLIWGSTGCSHCAALSDALSTTEGATWVSSQSAVFCLAHDTLTADTQNAKTFAKGTGAEALPEYPFVCFYWPSKSKEVRFVGRINCMPSTAGASLFEQFKESYAQFVGGSSSGGQTTGTVEVFFPFGDTENDRLEVVVGQTSVTIPVKRSAIGATSAAYIMIGKSYQPLAWQGDDLMTFATLSVPSNLKAGDSFTVQVLDAKGTTIIKTKVYVVSAVANSPKNPYWIGEKAANALTWGDWSMDIDAVTNRVAAYNATKPAKKAHALILVEGSCWCPDCAMAEKNFFDKQAFKDWATENKVIFGVLDIPNLKSGLAVPSLLRYETYKTSDDFVTLRGTVTANETERYQSGASYLSRHGVDYNKALAVSARNASLVGSHTTSNGWNNVMGALRTGVPVMILLRDDGTVAGRWNYFSSTAPKECKDGYLLRLSELLAQVDEPNEESDDSILTTAREIFPAAPAVHSSVSAVDQADIYRICGAEANDDVEVTVSGDAAVLKVSVIDETGTELAAVSGLASEGLSLKATLNAAACFLKIEPPNPIKEDDAFFGYASSKSTVCAYDVSLATCSNGGVFGFTVAKTNVMERCGTIALSVRREAGSSGAASVTVALLAPQSLPAGVSLLNADLTWASGEEGVKTAYVSVGGVDADVSLVFGLSNISVDAKEYGKSTEQIAVKVYDTDYAGDPIFRYVTVDKDIAVDGYQAGDTVRIDLLSGRLPTGVTLESDGGIVRAVGYATEAEGDCSATYRLTLVRGGTDVGMQDVTLDFTVIDHDFAGDIPSLETCRNYRNLPVVEGDEVKGLLQLAVPYDGTLSAKYMTKGQSFSYAAECWESFNVLSGTLTARLAWTGDSAKTMAVTLNAEGGTVTFDDPASGVARSFRIVSNAFPAGASAWQGRYTVQMPQTDTVDGIDGRLSGCAYMALQMTNENDVADGVMLYAGMLPNGCGFSGSSVLMTNQQGIASLPFYHVSAHRAAPYAFSGGLSIADKSLREAGLQWCVSNAWKTAWSVPDGLGHAGKFLAIGGLYKPEQTLALFAADFSTDLTDFAFTVDANGLTSGRYGNAVTVSAVPMTMSEDGSPLIALGTSNAQGVTLTFQPATGVVFGRFVLPFNGHSVSVDYRGIALPGWQTCADCSEKQFVQRPWAAGACSFSDRTAGVGIYRNGCAIGVGRYK